MIERVTIFLIGAIVGMAVTIGTEMYAEKFMRRRG